MNPHLDELISLCRHPKIQERRGEWDEFEVFCWTAWRESESVTESGFVRKTFTNWLIHPERCQTVASWLKRREM